MADTYDAVRNGCTQPEPASTFEPAEALAEDRRMIRTPEQILMLLDAGQIKISVCRS